MWHDTMWCDRMWCDMIWCDRMWCDVMWCDRNGGLSSQGGVNFRIDDNCTIIEYHTNRVVALPLWYDIDLQSPQCTGGSISHNNYFFNKKIHTHAHLCYQLVYLPFRELAARGTSTNQIAASWMLQAMWLATVASHHIVRQALLISLQSLQFWGQIEKWYWL